MVSSVGFLGRLMEHPTSENLVVVIGYTDNDYVGDAEDQKSTMGQVFSMVLWQSADHHRSKRSWRCKPVMLSILPSLLQLVKESG